jgi:hypothetical protein
MQFYTLSHYVLWFSVETTTEIKRILSPQFPPYTHAYTILTPDAHLSASNRLNSATDRQLSVQPRKEMGGGREEASYISHGDHITEEDTPCCIQGHISGHKHTTMKYL